MPYTKLVSLTNYSAGVVVRRWERVKGEIACTHAGVYDPPSVTHVNVTNYQAYGAPQDRLCVPRPLPVPARQRSAA